MIQSVSIVPESKDGVIFSVLIDFHINQRSLKHWALGFYMPRTFYQLMNAQNAISINPDLTAFLCEKTPAHTCFPLHYVNDHATYMSAGLTSIFAPDSQSHVLSADQDYQLELKHNNQHIPTGLTGVPQNFFLIEQDKSLTPLPEVLPEQYHLPLDNSYPIQATIKEHNHWKWENSIPRAPKQLADLYHLVPSPASIKKRNEAGFTLSGQRKIVLSDAFSHDPNAQLFRDYLQHDKMLTTTYAHTSANIRIVKNHKLQAESYRILVTKNMITIEASTTTGVFYALQTLRQLWNQHDTLPALQILDYPRFRYRGILLDVARHYFSVNDIKRLLDLMAAQKLNTLHLHLADDEGWRIDLVEQSHDPLSALVQIGGQRGYYPHVALQPTLLLQANLDLANHQGFTPNGKLIIPHYTNAKTVYGGYYSAQDIHALIAYANARYITIIPEIDLPGHARALKLSLPEVFHNSLDHSEYSSVNIYFDNVIPVCLYNTNTKQGQAFTQTLDTILARLDKLFAQQKTLYYSREISLAGDEVSSAAWTKDTSCQNQWATLSALDKSHYFFTALKQKIPTTQFSGWQQLVQTDEGDIGHYALAAPHTAHLYVWERAYDKKGIAKGIQHAIKLANAGYPTVLAFADDTYFDLTYTPDPWEPGSRWAGNFVDTYAALHSAYDATLTEKQLTPNNQHNLLGLEGAIWTESMPTFTHLTYMTLPKMTGLAEAAWAQPETTATNDGKINWQSLAYRLGNDNQGFLGYLARTYSVTYRGYPHGITREIND